ncbi:MAG: aminoacyl-tRNA hydrolase [Alphaproteobacteria bacterium]|nr:aminoacyl-tRNA hydrolase [Alphaproteobacteria bacterium]
MLLMVGLGNPGPEYAGHRHNIGFMALDAIAEAYGFTPWRSKFKSRVSEGQLGGVKVMLQKPETFMNRSGFAVAEVAHFYKLALDDLLILHDELDLAPGKVRIKEGGGVAGHNGLRSIAQVIGAKDFKRVRFGIGHPGDKAKVTGHVLGNFSKADRQWLSPLLDAVVAAAPLLAKGDDAGCMNKIALLTKPNEHKPDPGGVNGNGTRT